MKQTLDNKHVQDIGDSIYDFFGRSRDPEEIARRLRLGKTDHFDTTDDKKDFSSTEVRSLKSVSANRDSFTIFERDKLQALKDNSDKIEIQ